MNKLNNTASPWTKRTTQLHHERRTAQLDHKQTRRSRSILNKLNDTVPSRTKRTTQLHHEQTGIYNINDQNYILLSSTNERVKNVDGWITINLASVILWVTCNGADNNPWRQDFYNYWYKVRITVTFATILPHCYCHQRNAILKATSSAMFIKTI